MTHFLGNLITLLGGAGGILIGVVVVGFVIGILALPLIFISRKSELGPPENDADHIPAEV